MYVWKMSNVCVLILEYSSFFKESGFLLTKMDLFLFSVFHQPTSYMETIFSFVYSNQKNKSVNQTDVCFRPSSPQLNFTRGLAAAAAGVKGRGGKGFLLSNPVRFTGLVWEFNCTGLKVSIFLSFY